jgi:hypothetical protein
VAVLTMAISAARPPCAATCALRARYVRDACAIVQVVALSQVPPLSGPWATGDSSVRKLASGRWQASYWWEGSRYAAPSTFPLRGGATRWLSGVEADLARGAWVDPRAGQVTLADYSRQWLAARTDLRPRTRELYTSLLRLHIRPALGSFRIARITPSTVRNWFAELSGGDGPGQATAARTYRLLRTIMNTAVTDDLLIYNVGSAADIGASPVFGCAAVPLAPPSAVVDVAVSARLIPVVAFLLTVTFACGVLIAVAHVVNQRFVAPVYDVVANLTAFGCAVAASLLLGHPVPAILSGVAILCWLVLARRTVLDRRERRGEDPR